VEELRAQVVRRWDVTFTGEVPVEVLRSCGAVREVTVSGHTAHLTVAGSAAQLLSAAAPYGIGNVTTHEADLTQVFLRYYEREEEPWPA
jgi:ABC-2 type transport system ATP-binding protein